MIIKRITALILILIFVLNFFVSCKLDSHESIIPEIKLTNVYKSQYFDQPEGYWINNTYYLNDIIYVSYFKEELITDQKSEVGYCNNIIYKYNTNGEVIDIIYLIRDGYNNSIPSIDDTYYIAESKSISNISSDGSSIWELSIIDKYDIQLTGSAALYIDYTHTINYLYVLSGCKIGNQNGNILLVLTATGELVYLFHLDDYTSNNSVPKNIFKTPYGKIVFAISNNNRIIYYETDLNTKTINEYEMPVNPEYAKDTLNVFHNAAYSNKYDVYFNTNAGLYGYNIDESNSELLINWINSD